MNDNFYLNLKLIGIVGLYSIMCTDGKMKNPHISSPALYFCLWRISLHGIHLDIADLVESPLKDFFLLIIKASSSPDFLFGFQGKLGILIAFEHHL